jgi:hypothetical protein
MAGLQGSSTRPGPLVQFPNTSMNEEIPLHTAIPSANILPNRERFQVSARGSTFGGVKTD